MKRFTCWQRKLTVRFVSISSFFCFCECSIIEHILPPQYFTAGMADVRADSRVLRLLAEERLPKLSAHCSALNVELADFFALWLHSLFVVGMPMETCLRIWDCLFCEGSLVLFRFALALLKMFENDLLTATTDEQLMMMLSELPKRCFDVEQLCKCALI